MGTAAATGLMFIKPELVRGTAANSAIRLGLLGCGARGTTVATSFAENTNTRVVALADLFADQLEKARKHFDGLAAKKGYAGIDADLMFRGPKAYEQLVTSKEIDMVQISTPDYFHPKHLEAAIEAGKHIYCEKPAAVDVRGAKCVLRPGETAEGKLSLDIGFQLRSAPPFVEMVRRIHAGALGKIACASTYYHAGSIKLPPRPNASPLELRIRNWYWDRILTGDIVVDQNIHVIDICNWVLKGRPLKAVGAGGRKVRTDSGDCWDHFSLTFYYPDDVHVSFDSVQYGSYYGDVCERFFGSRGVSESHYSGAVAIYGEEPWDWWKDDASKPLAPGERRSALQFADMEKDKSFIDSITSGKFHNQAAAGVESALSAILGREAAYSGREITWDELLRSDQSYDAGLDLDKLG
jgi:predicted dehydrogenase